ncbi:MAG: glutamate racemase [Clostridia bacterium]|nr:glutamate racemase [Clostridia bacterium]
MNENPIGIFDSGVGGLTVLAEIKKRLPSEDIIYLGDTAHFPYGDKSKEDIVEYSRENVKTLIKKHAKIIVIACGTATSQAIDVLKEEFNVPIVGIIEPTVQYIKERNIKEIGVIATEGTIRSGAWENKLKNAVPEIHVINKACPMLATIAEEGRALGEEGRQVIKEYMKPFKENKIDKIILGCTHYPIYEKLIDEELGYNVELINTGVTVANSIKDLLKNYDIQSIQKKGSEEVILTKPEPYFKDIAKNILNNEIKIK